MRRMPVLRRAIEQLAPALRAAFYDREIVGREGHGGETAEELVRVAHRLAVDPGGPPFPPHLHLDFPHAARKLESAAHERRLLAADAHELRELLRPQRPQRAEQVAGLEEIGLPLAIRPEQDRRAPSEFDPGLAEVAERARADVEEKHLLFHADVDRHAGTGAPAQIGRRTPRRRLFCLGRDIDRRPRGDLLRPRLERGAGKDADSSLQRLPLRVAPAHAALRPVLALGVPAAALAHADRAWVPGDLLREPPCGGGEQERCKQYVHQIRIGMITAVYRAPRPGSPAGFSTPGDSSSQSSTFIWAVSTTWSTSIRYRALKPICNGCPLYETGISSFASPRSGFCEVTLSDPSRSSKRTAFVLRSLESRLMRFSVSSRRGRSTMTVRSASFGITCW